MSSLRVVARPARWLSSMAEVDRGLTTEDRRSATDWSDPDPARPVPFWGALRDDVIAHVPPEHRRRSRWSWAGLAAAIVVRSSGFHVVAGYRLAHTLRHRAGLPGRAVAGLLFWWNRHVYGCSIAPTARLHGGLMLPH